MKTSPCSAIACVAIWVLSACNDDDSPLSALASDDSTNELAATADDSSSGSDAGLARAELDWRNCGQFEDHNLECAEVLVPIDYDQPDGARLPIAVRRIRANPLEPYHGALLFNPGGPGGEGIDFTLSLFEGGIFGAIAPGYDIVGFDPRGVGASGETGCGFLPENLYPGARQTPVVEPTMADYVAYFKAEGERCEAEWGPLFRKLGSNNVVRDMEEIRKALNQPVLNFYGGSYGTQLGALYAHRYPETTGRMVLDASVQPRASLIQNLRGKLEQAVALHELLLSRCESGELSCPPDARIVFDQLVANARQRGLDGALMQTWTGLLGSSSGVLDAVGLLGLEAAEPGGDWIAAYFGGSGSGAGGGLSEVVNHSVLCTDDAFEPPTLAELEALAAELRQRSPLFADVYLPNAATCTGWPTTRDPIPMPTTRSAQPLLVIGGTADPLTPYDWSREMTEALGNATLLTSDHYGHGAVLSGGACVMTVIRAYLTSGSMPATGALCE